MQNIYIIGGVCIIVSINKGEEILTGLQLKKTTTIAIVSIVVVCLILLSYFFIYEYENVEPDDSETDEITEIDDRISPLTNQGLILEIKRIRHRGLLDKIMKFGISWRKNPSFYIVTEIDEGVYSSYKEYGFTYKTWDTIGQEFRNIRDVKEEQATSNITISCFEIVKKGIFRTNNIEKAKIELVYDYKTGRWVGDDYFGDSDGYGHYIGDNFEIWFNLYQTDFDHDGIPYWTETNVLGTDPQVDDSKIDLDNDGIPSSWEWKWGYNPHIWDDHQNLDPDIDGIENIEEYQMEKWFANPFSQDIYIEVDGMKKAGLFDKDHVLYDETGQIIIERFCRHNINVYIDNGWTGEAQNSGGELVPHVDEKNSWDSGMTLQYYKHHFPDNRKGIFRYVLICDNSRPAGYCGNSEFNRFDTIVMNSNAKFSIRTGLAFTSRARRVLQASMFLHELGHSLGIGPNTIAGCDNYSFMNKFLPTKERNQYIEEWGNYKSVMNYYYLYSKNIVDYSDGSHGYNDQNDWEKFYLPFFQTEVDVVVDPFYYPITKPGIDENTSVNLEGWEFSEELTKEYIKLNSDWSPLDSIKCDWNVFVKIDDDPELSDYNIRVYAKPIVPFSVWSLIKEGYLTEEGSLVFS